MTKRTSISSLPDGRSYVKLETLMETKDGNIIVYPNAYDSYEQAAYFHLFMLTGDNITPLSP